MIDKNENEQNFQDAQSKNDWEKMFMCVYYACTNICKSIYTDRKVVVPNELLNDVITDSTICVMKKVKEGVKIDKLSSYCYLWCLSNINNDTDTKWYKKQKKLSDFCNYRKEVISQSYGEINEINI